MKKIFILILFMLLMISCIEMPHYIEVEGLLVNGSSDIYEGYCILTETGVIYDRLHLLFYEPITNLDVGIKYTNHYEIVYDINPEDREDITKHLGKRVRIKGLEYTYIGEVRTNYFEANEDRAEFWRVYTNMNWSLVKAEIVKVLD